MATLFTMPKFGETMTQGIVVKWYKAVGDPIKKGETLLDIETDKATIETEVFQDGYILAILAEEGETLPVGAPLAYIGQQGEKVP